MNAISARSASYRELKEGPLTRPHGLTRRLPVLAALLLLTSLLAGRPGQVAVPAVAATAMSGPAPLAITEGAPAREPLRAIYAGLAQTGEAPASGRYVHTRQQIWSALDTPEIKGGVTQEVQRWRAPDRSAHELRVTLPAPPAAVPTGAPVIRDFAAGTYPLEFERPSSMPEILAGQLTPAGVRLPGPEHYLRAISTMYKSHCLDSAQRAAVIRVLADVDGLAFHPGIVDRAGRPGVGVSVAGRRAGAPGQLQDLLVFNPTTGDLLSHEQVMQVSAAVSGVRKPVVVSYVLYLACDYTDQRPSS